MKRGEQLWPEVQPLLDGILWLCRTVKLPLSDLHSHRLRVQKDNPAVAWLLWAAPDSGPRFLGMPVELCDDLPPECWEIVPQ